MHACYLCGKDVDPSDMHGVVAFEVTWEGGLTRAPRPRELEWAHKGCEEKEHRIDLTYSDRYDDNYVSAKIREQMLDDEAEAAFERQQERGTGEGFLSPDAMQRGLKR